MAPKDETLQDYTNIFSPEQIEKFKALGHWPPPEGATVFPPQRSTQPEFVKKLFGWTSRPDLAETVSDEPHS